MAFVKATVDTGGGAARLAEFGRTIRNRVLRKAVNAGTKPVYDAAKASAPVSSGTLKKAQGRTVKTYKDSGVVVGIVGTRTRPTFRRQVTLKRDRIFRMSKRGIAFRVVKPSAKQLTAIRDPRFYMHLIIKGTRRTRKNDFIHAAWARSQAQAKEQMLSKLQTETQAEAKKFGVKKR